LDFIRLDIIRALKHDDRHLSGQRKINPKIQEVRAKKSEELFMTQDIQRNLMKVKSKLEQMTEIQEEESPAREETKETRWRDQPIPQASLIRSNRRVPWREQKSTDLANVESSTRRKSKIYRMAQCQHEKKVADETKGMAERYTRWKLQDIYPKSKSVAMKKYISKRESLPCPIE
jgi:hypothetical protein